MSDMINEEEKIGKISIADGVVASIAGIAAIEVEGVSKLTGNISKELVAKLGKKNLANGVKVEITDGNVVVDVSLEVEWYKHQESIRGRAGEGKAGNREYDRTACARGKCCRIRHQDE